ncbi:serine hydrolase domain-containing protein [Labedaea rhizosphaerae]|uniref:CubicO group peptidase (Beta-lactamase class C family) n=1 Tax=Labedaea rhizosphaerae TaxID=598644 RepID=A0A4R6S095_LABRH|nr:serine hydrolase domain-containing protein [Labedaea rhizosphaerae]TDP92902.1 CubicO group peptidase (beta-lactamase class C family) [Labedaea rhizosphaerae]
MPDPEERLPRTAAACREAVASGAVLGVYVSAGHRDEIAVNLAVGHAAPGVPATVGDIGELRCAVKPLTTLCIAHAVESGLLDLDDTLSRWAPAGAGGQVRALSLRQLLTHAAGLPNFVRTDVYDVGFDEYVAMIFAADMRPRAWYGEPIYNLALGWHLLAWVLQQVYGAPISKLVAELVTTPLGLAGLGLIDEGRLSRPVHRRTLDRDYQPVRDTDEETFATRPNPAYGGFASTDDHRRLYAHLARALAADEDAHPVVGSSTLRELVRPHGTLRFRSCGPALPFGLGFFVGGAAVGFGPDWGARCFGHMGSIRAHHVTAALCDPASTTAVAVALSSVGPANNDVFLRLGKTLHADLFDRDRAVPG